MPGPSAPPAMATSGRYAHTATVMGGDLWLIGGFEGVLGRLDAPLGCAAPGRSVSIAQSAETDFRAPPHTILISTGVYLRFWTFGGLPIFTSQCVRARVRAEADRHEPSPLRTLTHASHTAQASPRSLAQTRAQSTSQRSRRRSPRGKYCNHSGRALQRRVGSPHRAARGTRRALWGHATCWCSAACRSPARWRARRARRARTGRTRGRRAPAGRATCSRFPTARGRAPARQLLPGPACRCPTALGALER